MRLSLLKSKVTILKKHAKNNKAKMVIYNALPRKEYERIFVCNTEKEIWKTLLIAHQGNNQVKDNKIDILVQQYEQLFISEDETIHSAFARFNTIITSLKALDEGYSSKNYVRKFLRDLHPKWRAKIQRISLTAVSSSKRRIFYHIMHSISPCLLVLITGTSQSRQHVITSLIHIESCKSPTKSMFDVGSSRISSLLEYCKYQFDGSGKILKDNA
ncbi:hypothetical protein Tco_0590246 [Tanacetum coccineum]